MPVDPRTLRRGIYRIKRPRGIEDDAHVEDAGTDMPLPESIYRQRGYEPPFDDLPWSDDYFASKDKQHSP